MNGFSDSISRSNKRNREDSPALLVLLESDSFCEKKAIKKQRLNVHGKAKTTMSSPILQQYFRDESSPQGKSNNFGRDFNGPRGEHMLVDTETSTKPSPQGMYQVIDPCNPQEVVQPTESVREHSDIESSDRPFAHSQTNRCATSPVLSVQTGGDFNCEPVLLAVTATPPVTIGEAQPESASEKRLIQAISPFPQTTDPLLYNDTSHSPQPGTIVKNICETPAQQTQLMGSSGVSTCTNSALQTVSGLLNHQECGLELKDAKQADNEKNVDIKAQPTEELAASASRRFRRCDHWTPYFFNPPPPPVIYEQYCPNYQEEVPYNGNNIYSSTYYNPQDAQQTVVYFSPPPPSRLHEAERLELKAELELMEANRSKIEVWLDYLNWKRALLLLTALTLVLLTTQTYAYYLYHNDSFGM